MGERSATHRFRLLIALHRNVHAHLLASSYENLRLLHAGSPKAMGIPPHSRGSPILRLFIPRHRNVHPHYPPPRHLPPNRPDKSPSPPPDETTNTANPPHSLPAHASRG